MTFEYIETWFEYIETWEDQMLSEEIETNIGRFLWWVENAGLDELTDDQMEKLKRACSILEEIETEIESALFGDDEEMTEL